MNICHPQRPYARHSKKAVKIWSDLHGNMQNVAEMTTSPVKFYR